METTSPDILRLWDLSQRKQSPRTMTTKIKMILGAFVGCSGNAAWGAARLDSQSVCSQFDGIDASEAAPEQVILPVVLNEEGVNGVLDAYLVAAEQFALVLKGTLRSVGCGAADAARPFASPYRHGVVEDVSVAYAVDIRCPQAAFGLKVGSCLFRESCTYQLPVHQIA